jgi:hypothetical protein
MRERIRYFTGRHMTARDFRDADAYHRTMRHLHNRVLHGWGVACGLAVATHPRPECGLVVQCGLALDCCGREIVVPHALAERIPWDRLPECGCGPGGADDDVLLLCLEYREDPTERVPVLYDHNACAGTAFEDGRIREGYRLHWHVVRASDLARYGWQQPGACGDEAQHDPCGPDAPSCCLDPHCPTDACVALAVVRGSAARPAVDTAGRRAVGNIGGQLTHICRTSWPHGGVIGVSQFARTSIRFDRPLAMPAGDGPAGATGINERTFYMQFGEPYENLDVVAYANRPPYLLADRRTAVFDVNLPENHIGHAIQVTLRCDFILDCHGNPVDGTHLRGRLPTGNGTMGGNFESWFRVVSDEDFERLNRQGATS